MMSFESFYRAGAANPPGHSLLASMATHPPFSHHFSTDQRQQVTITPRASRASSTMA
jgi:hypothetical protein